MLGDLGWKPSSILSTVLCAKLNKTGLDETVFVLLKSKHRTRSCMLLFLRVHNT